MRRDTSKPHVVWNADVKAETLDEFVALFPMTGAQTWLIRTALDKFIEAVQHSPRLQRIVHNDIQEMLRGDEEKIGLRSINLKITRVQYERFNDLFPEWGSVTWFFRRVLTSTVSYMQEHNLNLEELVEVSVNNVLREPQGRPLL